MPRLTDFIARKRKKHERAKARHASRKTQVTWTMRLRVRLASTINTDEAEIKTSFMGRRVVIMSHKKGTPIKDSKWVIFIARRFKSIETAAEFGIALQSALAAIAAVRNIPIDVGADNCATAAFSEVVKDAVAKVGAYLINDVHGVDVYPDTQTAMVLAFEASFSTSMPATRLTGPLEKMGKRAKRIDDLGRDAALLLNAAFMAEHPVAMLVLSLAAVELLAVDEKWSVSQSIWLEGISAQLVASSDLSETEKGELRESIQRLRKVSVRSSAKRLLQSLELSHLWRDWDALYGKRSRLFHGDKFISNAEIRSMGGEARQVCQQIVEAYLAQRIGPLDDVIGDQA